MALRFFPPDAGQVRFPSSFDFNGKRIDPPFVQNCIGSYGAGVAVLPAFRLNSMRQDLRRNRNKKTLAEVLFLYGDADAGVFIGVPAGGRASIR